MKIHEIPRYPQAIDSAQSGLIFLPELLESYNVDTDPPYQRGHVWNDAQKIAYVEHVLKGGDAGLFVLNDSTPKELASRKYELVDGKQRISAILAFLSDDILAFGVKFSEIEDNQKLNTFGRVKFSIYGFEDQRDVVALYLSLNNGGSIHTDADLQVARDYLNSLL